SSTSGPATARSWPGTTCRSATTGRGAPGPGTACRRASTGSTSSAPAASAWPRSPSPPSEKPKETVMQRIKQIARKCWTFVRAALAAVALGMIETFGSPRGRRLLAAGALLGCLVLLVARPPMQVVAPGEVGVRINSLTGGIGVLGEGPALMVPLVHELRRYPVRDQVYRPQASTTADGAAPFQTVEGLSVGVAVTVRYSLDRDRVGEVAKRL